MDFGQPSLTSRFTIRVHVADVNDNAPGFTQANYQLSVEENRPIDTVLERFTATDLDSGRNAEIEYFLDNAGMEYFRIDPKDGTLYTKTSFDREIRQKTIPLAGSESALPKENKQAVHNSIE
ncbi:unnamed protein product [Echinostoma caproni]|uniref:CA domain-containing protein n=1 Tax=Echinostoma caproni TaxID=27848 RepID=A0A183AWU2_9TREM|nr:unnamed protein product [Echinostoma caproni]